MDPSKGLFLLHVLWPELGGENLLFQLKFCKKQVAGTCISGNPMESTKDFLFAILALQEHRRTLNNEPFLHHAQCAAQQAGD